jgi:hypothetical protein
MTAILAAPKVVVGSSNVQCCKSLFAAGDHAAVRQLTGDSGNGFEAALIDDRRSFRPLAENQPQSFLGLLQHYLADVPSIPMDVCYWGERT